MDNSRRGTSVILTLACYCFGGLSLSLGCAWDSDTLRDEANAKADLYDLVTGQFPHHGKIYYEERVRRINALTSPNFQQRNDLAVAYLRLEEWEASEALLNRNLAESPQDYHTLSNLAVLSKKQGDYVRAAERLVEALKIKPAGHMGLGDWYLKDLEFRALHQADSLRVPSSNFLGTPYSESFPKEGLPGYDFSRQPVAPELANRYLRLIENDQTFADGFLTVGDYCSDVGDLNLAYLCYKRAQALKHPNPREVTRRLRALQRHFVSVGFQGGGPKAYRAYLKKVQTRLDKMAAEAFREAATWLAGFKRVEGELVLKLGPSDTTPAIVEAEMKDRDLDRWRPSK